MTSVVGPLAAGPGRVPGLRAVPPPAAAGERPAVRVVVVSDYRLVVDAICRAVGTGPTAVAGTAATVAEGVEVVRRLRPDVAVVTDRLPDGTGLDVVRRLATAAPATAAVLVGVAPGLGAPLVPAVRAGCRGFVTRDQSLDDLLTAVRVVADGGSVHPPELRAILAGRLGRRPAPPDELSDRELEVLAAVAAGRSIPAIAELLYLSPHTVRNHVKRVLAKLGAHSRLEAVAVARRTGLL